MTKYGLKTEITEHLAGLGLSNDEQDSASGGG